LDFYCYGNTFISIHYPFHKYLKCKKCGWSERVEKIKYAFRDMEFAGECSQCHTYGNFKAMDYPIRSVRDLRLIRWNPEYITVQHNEATGETRYFYTIPPILANDIRLGKRQTIETIPQVFLQAMKDNKALLFSKDNLYHMKRPTIAQKDKGWGIPMILPVLKDTFYLQILRKAQEAIAVEHIVPLRIIFPQTASASADIYSTVNLTKWRDQIEREIMRWRLDNNYIPIMPLPVGQQTLGGDGRALMLAQEYRVWAEHIISGMGVPVEFVFGGLSYSGSNVSLRMLENHFLDSKSDHLRFVRDFLIPNIGSYLNWDPIDAHFRRFKMADDLQRSAFNFQLNQAGKLSDKSMLEENDWDGNRESERIALEKKQVLQQQKEQALGQAAIQGEAQLLLQKYQIRGQKGLMEAQQAGVQMDPQAMGEMQEAGMMMAGAPGMSPDATGQAMLSQQSMMNQAGMIPPPAENAQALMQQQQMEQQATQQQAGAQQGAVPTELQSPLQSNQGPGAGTPFDLANRIAGRLDQLPQANQQSEIAALQQHNPQLASLVMQVLNSRGGAHRNSNAEALPTKKPPRRGREAAIV